jgi:hypothetical protein
MIFHLLLEPGEVPADAICKDVSPESVEPAD